MKETVDCEAERAIPPCMNIQYREPRRDFASRYSLSKLSRRSTPSSITVREGNFFFSRFCRVAWESRYVYSSSFSLIAYSCTICLLFCVCLLLLDIGCFVVYYILILYRKSISLLFFYCRYEILIFCSILTIKATFSLVLHQKRELIYLNIMIICCDTYLFRYCLFSPRLYVLL